jgi:hypothetical protein
LSHLREANAKALATAPVEEISEMLIAIYVILVIALPAAIGAQLVAKTSTA